MNGSDMKTEEKLRSALARRAGSVHVDDPNPSLKQRIVALRQRRQRRMALGSAAIAVVVAAVAFAPVLATSHHDGRAAAPAATGANAQPGVLVSKLVRDTHPTVPPSVVDALTNANTSTAIDLYHQLAANPGNLFFSPYSISTALGMAAAGARGDTLAQMLELLHDTLPADQFHDASNALNLALLAPRQAPTGGSGNPLELELANSVWSQTGFHVEPGFLDLLARDYGAALNTLDFQSHAAEATKTIDAWVAANTNNKIRDLFASLDPETRLVLVNAVHFKASWQQPFLPSKTHDGQFTTATGSTVTVPFMHGLKEKTSYSSGAGWQAVDLPYIGDASMTVIVPDAGQFQSFERSLDPTLLAHIVGSMSESDVTLALPKLQLKDKIDLVPELKALGMTDAFENADFSGITGKPDLLISQVVHQATVTVDETGTEAAAATGIAFAQSAARPVNLSVDRPYLFLIRDHVTGSVLFVGRVTDPTQTEVQQ
jgi:serpin B